MKKYRKIITGFVTALALVMTMAPTMNVRAAEASSEKSSARTYTVTLRAGNVGKFDISKIASKEGTVEVAENYVKFTVERDESLVSQGYFGSQDDFNSWVSSGNVIITKTSKDSEGNETPQYVLKDVSSIDVTAGITRNTEYVLDYGKLVDPVSYTIQYVDSTSGEQLTTPTIAYGSNGDTISASPLSISNYTAIDAATTITLEKGKTNTITFRYTYSGVVGTVTSIVTTFVPGTTTTNTVTNEVPTTAPAAAANAGGAAGGAGAVVIPDDNTPLADGANAGDAAVIPDEETPLADAGVDNTDTTIEDEETPLADGAEVKANSMVAPIIGGVAAVIAVAAVVMLVYRKRKTAAVKTTENTDKKEK